MKTPDLNSNTTPKAEGILSKTSKVGKPATSQSKISKAQALLGWFSHDTMENLTFTQAALRGAALIVMPLSLSLFDSSYHTDILPFIVPVMFYLEVTAFTMYCPIKAIFSSQRIPEQYD